MLQKYSFVELCQLIINKIITLALYSNSRIIRQPFYIRGKKNIDLGKNLTTGVGCRLDAFTKEKKTVLIFGNNVQINDYVHIAAVESVSIGNDVLIASKVFISDHSHGKYSGEFQDDPSSIVAQRELSSKSVIINDNVWIGEFVSILPGVKIGKNSIIGTMSVVTKDIPDNCIAVGSPAKVVKKYNFETNQWEKV